MGMHGMNLICREEAGIGGRWARLMTADQEAPSQSNVIVRRCSVILHLTCAPSHHRPFFSDCLPRAVAIAYPSSYSQVQHRFNTTLPHSTCLPS